MALLKHNAVLYRTLASMSAILQTGAMVRVKPSQETSVHDGPLKISASQLLRSIRDEVAIASNPVIIKQIDRALKAMQDEPEFSKWLKEITEVEQRIDDLLEGENVFLISADKCDHYLKPFSRWNGVIPAFPSALDNIEEAEKSYALGLNTACVFHCMGIMHQGLLALSKDLEATVNPIVDTWETIIAAIEGGVNKKRNSLSKADWKTVEDFYAEAVSDLRSVKNAWRNPTAHFTRTYTEPQAEKVLAKVRDFMLHLSTRIKE
jgi:hypothetical protein